MALEFIKPLDESGQIAILSKDHAPSIAAVKDVL
jgi:hypothetical protein